MRFGMLLRQVQMLLLMAGGGHALAVEQFAAQRAVMSVSVTVVERCTASSQGVAASATSTNNAAQLANFSVRCTSGRTSGYSASMRQHAVFDISEIGPSSLNVASANPPQPGNGGDAANLRFRVDY